MNPLRWPELLSDDPATQIVIAGAMFVVWVVIAYVIGRYGEHKGYPFSPAFFLCFFVSPIVVFLILALLPERPRPPKPLPLEMILEIERAKLARKQAEGQGQAS